MLLDFIGVIEQAVFQDVTLSEKHDRFVDVRVEEKSTVFRWVDHQEAWRGALKVGFK